MLASIAQLGLGPALDALGDLAGHSGVEFAGYDLSDPVEHPDCDVAGAGADFEDDVGWF